MFKKADEIFCDLGFEKFGKETEYGVSYRKKNNEFNFTQILEIGHKEDGNHLFLSYVEGTNSDGFNNCVGLTYPEMKAAMKKYRELKRKYRW